MASIGLGTILVVGGILLISWRADEHVKDFRPWFVIAPLLAAILGGVGYPIRRYALRFADEPIFFGAVVGIVGLFCTSAFLALPSTKDRLVWNRDSIGYFIAGGAFESLGLLLVLYALTFGPVVMVTPLTATLPLWVVILSRIFLRDVEKITPRIVTGAALVVAGTIAPTTEAARQVLDLARSGFQFQASVGVAPGETEQVRAGTTVQVNGRTIKAGARGFTLGRSSVLKEVSIVPLGADAGTSVSIAFATM